MHKRTTILTSAALALTLLVSACAPRAATPTDSGSITIYSGRTESLVAPLIEQFTKDTGIKAQVRYGGTAELAATIQEEGRNSPADVYFAQDPGGLGAIEQLLAPLPDSILNQVDPKFRAPSKKWVGVSGRARVVVYNTDKLKESDLPDDIAGFTDPKWKGRIGWAPTNASFQAMVTAMRVIWGEDKTAQWLNGIQANQPKVFPNNTSQVNAAAAGEIDIGFPNHYYLYGVMRDKGENIAARNYYFRGGGPGAVVLVAGAGVLDSSKNKPAAQRFIDYLVSPAAQQYFALQTYEYPVISGIITHKLLKPMSEINTPSIDVGQLADLKGTLALLRQTGVIP